jgi:DNA topoisomerase-1
MEKEKDTHKMTKLVIVESPAKAKTINNYLGNDYHVIASYGHIRDLPTKQGSVLPEQRFQMVWELNDRGKKQLKDIISQLKSCDEILLATDPDREGEAISWHVTEELKQQNALNKPVRRVVFNEITKSAIQKAIDNPRNIDKNLVSAYLARRALDYLMGFTLSPVLWRKLPGSRSAGRVQSVALRLIADREAEIELFKTQEYWTINGQFFADKTIDAQLISYKDKKLERLDITHQAEADAIVKSLEDSVFNVHDIQTKQVKRNPFAPFITSTLQQEASRKLGFSASKTMQLAQQLYEGIDINGKTIALITYMRTDSTNLSNEALHSIRDYINKSFEKRYLPEKARQYKTKSKNAQEAHEAIRPVDPHLAPKAIEARMQRDLWRLYDLIWKRAVSSQMSSADIAQTRLDIQDSKKISIFRATGSIIQFDGFMALYNESSDDDTEEKSKILPALESGQHVDCKEIRSEQHFTQPPARYSEASLIKRLEELGIGRPSTYANIIKVLQDRDYVRLDKKRFYCEDRGRIVTAFLHNFFEQYVEYDFTAQMETQLDEVADGSQEWETILRTFWDKLQEDVKSTNALRITEVIDALNHDLENYLFPIVDERTDRRKCPECQDGVLSLKLGKFGSFIGCSHYPTCNYTRKLSTNDSSNDEDKETQSLAEKDAFKPKEIGVHPQTQAPILLKKGPYGFYLEMEEPHNSQEAPKKKTKVKPKRASIPKTLDPEAVDLSLAIQLLSLPRTLGNHPETGWPIIVNKGRFGPYIQYNDGYTTLPESFSIYTVTLSDALELLAKPKEKKTKKKT